MFRDFWYELLIFYVIKLLIVECAFILIVGSLLQIFHCIVFYQ